MEMKKSTSLFDGKGEAEDWITVKGNHVPVEGGKSKKETAKAFIQDKQNKQNNAGTKKDGQTPNKEKNNENSPKLNKTTPPPDEEAEELKKIEEEKQRAEEEKKKKRQEQFSKDVDEVLAGTYKGSHVTLLDNTPKILQDIGMADKPMLMTAKHVYTCAKESGKYVGRDINYHGLGADFIKQVPTLLESPKLVFKSKNNENEVIAVVDAVDKKGRPLIVPILMNGVGRQNNQSISANIVKSIYGKDNFDKYIKANATEQTILYKKEPTR